MEEILNIVEKLVPIITTFIGGFITFLITKYTYHKNIPLDKLEIAYNRVYYPLYIIIKKENTNVDDAIKTISPYIQKYMKYIDRSTLIAFNSLSECETDAKKNVAYQNLKSNIYDRNSSLRRRLGYLEPNFLQLYKYSSKSEKSTFRILMETCFLYIFILFGELTTGKVQVVFILCALVLLVVAIGEIIWKFCRFVYYKIKK